MLLNTGTEAVPSNNKLLTTVAWKVGDRMEYALEGSVFIGGAVVQWLRDGLGIIRHSAEVETLAATVKSSEGVFLVPAFVGLGAPYWDSYARGTMVGITRGTTAAHIARAAMDSIAFQSAQLLECMQQDSHTPLHELRVDGGASNNNAMMQFQADILGVPVVRPRVTETTALGAAYLADWPWVLARSGGNRQPVASGSPLRAEHECGRAAGVDGDVETCRAAQYGLGTAVIRAMPP